MNDFTLEELDEIKRCLKYMIKGNVTPYSNLTIELNKKLQLMMENYGKHLMLDLEEVLQSRLESLEHLAQQGVIPGQIDSIELQRLNGRISELQFILELLAADRD